MGEAKSCLKVLFELASESRRKEVGTETQISELQNQHAELLKKLTAQENQIKIIQTNHEHELSNVAKDCEEKIAVLLRQLRNIPVAEGIENEYEERYLIQQKALEQAELKVETMMLENEKNVAALHEENNNLRQTIHEIKSALPKKKPKSEPSESGIKAKSDKALEKTSSTVTVFESALDDSLADPDWRKTPLSERIRQMRSYIQPVSEDRLTVKRASDGSCACKGNCTAKNCGCKKVLKSCGSFCKCVKEKCKNREDSESRHNDTEAHSSTTEEEDSFKRPRQFNENIENISINLRNRRLEVPRFDFTMAD
ncbi:hypothetical protein ILUMI_13899 [Ignelater luminosus]|uniref:Tesmin/TSO1-like CXC domain-containing protein n=1 Tax=Ignelater luminosus TaxID=2038154 RepID=A0A8K0GAH2_IGNLU|nr:hypothetical protein ILUMI_13899 [Ignelater luminosus]